MKTKHGYIYDDPKIHKRRGIIALILVFGIGVMVGILISVWLV